MIQAISFSGDPKEPNALVIDITVVTDVLVVDNKNNIILVWFGGSVGQVENPGANELFWLENGSLWDLCCNIRKKMSNVPSYYNK